MKVNQSEGSLECSEVVLFIIFYLVFKFLLD
jgi:hypothetical protein